MLRNMLLLLLLLLCCTACPGKKHLSDFKGKDAIMLDRVRDIGIAINKYQMETAEWPQTLREVEPQLDPGVRWPLNPYNNKPIEDTGSESFDPAKSVGNVFYMKHIREDQVTNYSLYIFGEKGLLVVLGNSDFQPRK